MAGPNPTWACQECGALHTRPLDRLRGERCGDQVGAGRDTCPGRLAPIEPLQCVVCQNIRYVAQRPSNPATQLHCRSCGGRLATMVDIP